jgi:hypothetical protein
MTDEVLLCLGLVIAGQLIEPLQQVVDETGHSHHEIPAGYGRDDVLHLQLAKLLRVGQR